MYKLTSCNRYNTWCRSSKYAIETNASVIIRYKRGLGKKAFTNQKTEVRDRRPTATSKEVKFTHFIVFITPHFATTLHLQLHIQHLATMSDKVLFTLPIADTTGSITCTQPLPLVYLLTFISPPDNRLRTDFCQAFILALDIIEVSYTPGVVVTSSSSPKFFSNGLDLEHAFDTPRYYLDSLFAMYSRLASYPMPTVALVNGHAFAGKNYKDSQIPSVHAILKPLLDVHLRLISYSIPTIAG